MGKKGILAIDVGSSAVKIFAGEVTQAHSVVINGSGIMPTEGFVKGAVTDIQALTKVIRQAVDCVAMTVEIPMNYAYIGIGGMGLISFCGVGSVAPASSNCISDDDVDRVCRAAVVATVPEDYEVLHVLPKYFLVDGQKHYSEPIDRKGNKLEVEACIVAIPKTTLNEFVQAVESTGIGVAGIVANAVSASRVVVSQSEVTSCLVLDIGSGTTDLTIYRAGKVSYVASLPLGGDYVTKDIMQGLDITYLHAEEIKRYYAKLDNALYGNDVILDCNDYGTTDKNVPYDFLYDIVESRLNEIAYLIFEHLQLAMVEVAIEKIYITGGFVAMPSISERLRKIFGIPVDCIVPKGLSAEYSYLTNTACYGVACYAAQQLPVTKEFAGTTWSSLLSKVKRFLSPRRCG